MFAKNEIVSDKETTYASIKIKKHLGISKSSLVAIHVHFIIYIYIKPWFQQGFFFSSEISLENIINDYRTIG
jgi:hypothetical protein